MKPTRYATLFVLLTSTIMIEAVADDSPAKKKTDTHPNIVVILVDDMGYGDPGCFNPNSQILTPAIDSLARDGMKFTDAHAPGPLCHLSRYGLLTGEYPFRQNVGEWSKRPIIGPEQMTIAKLAKSQGYRTAMVGKWHLGFDERNGYQSRLTGGPIDCGFDRFFGIRASTDIPPYFYIRNERAVSPPTQRIEANKSDGWSPIQGAFWRAGGIAPDLELANVLPRLTEEAIDAIDNHAHSSDSSPLMLYLAYPAPHTPWLPSEPFVGKSGAGMYGDFLMMVDAEIGKVLSRLEEHDMTQNTLVVFTSDNGPVWYAKDRKRFGHDSVNGLRGMKADAWEGGHRMPFIVRWPDVVSPSTESHQLVCFTDLLATLADLLDVPLPPGAGPDSFSFLHSLRQQQPPTDASHVRSAIAMQPGSKKMMTYRSGNWKLITGLGSGGFCKPNRQTPGPNDPTGQLYNLKEDRAETKNRYRELPKLVERLENELDQIVNQGHHRPQSVDPSTLHGKLMVGYQGWFNCQGDGMRLGWKHWARDGREPVGPGNVTVDLWPDVSELEKDELFPTNLQNPDGSPAHLFSSAHPKTVHRHFRWMRDYGIHGAFVQRFANGLTNPRLRANKNRVLANTRMAAERNGRVIAVMYDLTGMQQGSLNTVVEDWKHLNRENPLSESPAYLHHRGKPLVALWGIGFRERHQPGFYSLKDCRELVDAFKAAGCSVLLGVPSWWREQVRDSLDDKELHAVLEMADVLSPWSVGRYRNSEEAREHAKRIWEPDHDWCQGHHLDFMPVIFPGFSWHHLKRGKAPLGQIPRRQGQFFQAQIDAALKLNSGMIYVAMFDEVDEGTAIFKCSNTPPGGNQVDFLTYEGLPSDHYLRLAGQLARQLEKQSALRAGADSSHPLTPARNAN